MQGKGQGLSGAAAHVAGSSDNALIAMSGIERSWLEPSLDLRIDRYEAPAQGKLARFPPALRGSLCMRADDDVGVP